MHRDLERLVAEMVESGIHFGDAAREFEKRFLEHALRRSDGSITRCAALTGLHRNTLARKIAEHGLKG
jgi:DNA-binding NtrC family response regulator